MKYSSGGEAPFNEQFENSTSVLSEKMYPTLNATVYDTMNFSKQPSVPINNIYDTTSNFAQGGGAKILKKYKKNINIILNKLSKKYLKNKKTNIRKIIKNEFKK